MSDKHETFADLTDQLERALKAGRDLRAKVTSGGTLSGEQLAKLTRINDEASELIEQRNALETSIELQRVSDAQLGADLSGGRIKRGVDELGDPNSLGQTSDEMLRQIGLNAISGQGPRTLNIPIAAELEERSIVRSGGDERDLALHREELSRRMERTYQTGDTTTAPGGGYAVPTMLARQLIDYMEVVGGVMRAGPRVINTASGSPLNLATIATHNTATGATSEAASASATEDKLGRVSLGVSKYTARADITREEIQDEMVGLVSSISMILGRVIGRKRETAYTLVAAPAAGLASGAQTVQVAASASTGNLTPGYTDVVNWIYSLDQAYRDDPARTVFMLPKLTLQHLMTLTADGRPLFTPTAYGGLGNTLLGYRVVENNLIPKPVKNKLMGVVAHWPTFMAIRNAGAMSISASAEFQFDKGVVTYIGSLRTGQAITHLSAASWLQAGNK